MKNIKAAVLLVMVTLVATTFSIHAHAALVGISGKVTRIATGWGGEGIYIAIDTPLTTNCPNSWATYMATSAVQYKETVSIAMSAQAQGKQLIMYYDSSACPTGNVPQLLGVTLVN